MTDSIIGIVVKKIKFGAEDEVITLLCEDELVSFIAKGVRKITSKNRNALDYGNIISAEIFRARLKGKLSKLKKALIVKQPPLMISDTAKVVFSIMQLLSKLESPSSKLFRTILISYDYLGENYNHHVKTLIAFNILDSFGAMPRFDGCVECNRTDRIVSFDYKDGGLKCVWHTKRERPVEELKAILNINKGIEKYKDTDPLINKKLYKELLNILREYIYIIL